MIPVPTSAHNEALSGDTLYSAFLNYEWRQIVLPFVISGMEQIAAAIEDESDRQAFESLYGAMIDDFYNEEIVDGTPVGTIMWYIGVTASIPPKWLKCEGQILDDADYPNLADVLDAPFHVHPDIFLPDLTEKFLYGAAFNSDLGDTGGSSTHTLSIAELPAHSHVQRGRNSSGGANLATALATGADNTTLTSVTTTANAGSGNAHNNMPPYMRGYWIIKVLP